MKRLISKFLKYLTCRRKGHDVIKIKRLSFQADLVECKKCGKRFAYMHSGEWQGCLLPYTKATEDFYNTFADLYKQ